jgi:geranylgeranyl diphosphate synthase type I
MFEEEKEKVENGIKKLLKSKLPEELYDASAYLILAGGKRLRPILAMKVCEFLDGDDKNKAIPLGVSLELIHNFTLLHDDIMDKDETRRGVKTAHMVYGEPFAILAGDTLFSLAFENIAENYEGEIARKTSLEIAKMTREICDGQALDMLFEKRNDVEEEEYTDMIYKKTARLFESGARCGALIANAEESEIENMARMGKNLGMGFQMADDVLDLTGKEEKIGKRIGNDIRRGKKTLIAIHALKNASCEQRKKIVSTLGNGNAGEGEIKEVIEIFDKIGSIGYSQSVVRGYFEEAKKGVKKGPLLDLINYMERREE